ncbi:MAG: AAA family ATPase, partial [Proteiniphilum sp.]|nr:AAA family ATPase [Proteiniphilum sp.]
MDPYQLAFDIALNTDRSLFVTGKAGTGKTTFLHRLKEASRKQMAVVAPTGVAAINAGGTTIHSFFQLPFTP